MSGPLLRKRREAGSDPKAFGQQGMRPWVVGAVVALAATAVLPIVAPNSAPWLNRTTPAISLFFFLAAVGWWFRMQERAFAVAGAFVVVLYATTAWAPSWFDVQDFTVLALLSSFAVFALAGFNLVFILEEMLFDAHRELHIARQALRFVPTALVYILAVGLPVLTFYTGFRAPAIWAVSLVWAFVYLGWWTFRAVHTVDETPVLRELHMLTAGTLGATALVDLTRLIRPDAGVLPSVLMYGVLVGTWIYVSYTTLQRTHFLLPADNAIPWLCLLLSASFALLQHAAFHYQIEGARAVTILVEQRLAYLVFGVWLGLGFYVVQTMWRIFQELRDSRDLSARSRILAGSLARVAEGLMTTEQRLQGAAISLFHGMDRILPGHHAPPQVPGSWDLDSSGLTEVEPDGLTVVDEAE